jgi:hypothetical protein
MVSLRRQRALRVAPQPERLAQIGRAQAEVAGEAGGDAHVLRHQRELEAGGEGARQDLLRDLALRGAVPAGRRIDRFQHRLRIEAERPGHQQDFEAGQRARRAEVVVQRLDRVPGAERAAVEDIGAHLLQDRARTLDVRRRAADHDGERRVLRFGDRAGDRRVHHGDAVRGERASERPGACRVGRAHVDDEPARLEARQRLEHDLADDIAVGQHGDEHIHPVHSLPHGGMTAVARPVVRLQRIAGPRQVGGHRPAHGAEADEGYSFDAKTSFAQRNATTAAGTPQ